MIIIILLVSLPFDSQADSYTYKNYSVERWMGLDFVQKYSLVFQMRRAIRLGMQWGHPRAAKKGVVLTVGDESFGAGCLLHASTGTVMDEIEAVAKKNPEIKEWGLFQAVAAVVLVECKSFGDSVSDFNLN
jgi:hypothetical protein